MKKYKCHITTILFALLILSGCARPEQDLEHISTENSSSVSVDEIADLNQETRDVIWYDIAPLNSVKLDSVKRAHDEVDYNYSKSIYESDEIKFEIVHKNDDISFVVNNQTVDNISITRLLCIEVMFYDVNNDGKKDIIIKAHPFRAYQTTILLSKGSGYVDIGGKPEENIEIESKLLDDFKMHVVCRQYNVDMIISICDVFKAELLENNVYDSNGKILKEYDMSGSYWINDVLEYYEVDGKLVMVKKKNLMNQYCSTGCSVICQYIVENEQYKLQDIEFVEENYDAW